MKLTRIFQNISIAVIITALGLTSCDYLDVVPPEQPNIDDAMSSPTRALGFLYSCYGGVSTDLPSAYLGNKLYDRRICITLFMEHRRLLGRLCI